MPDSNPPAQPHAAEIARLLPHPRPWRFWRLFWRGIWRLMYRLEVQGREHIPAAGPLLLAPNHVSYMDPWVVNIAQDRPLCFMTWDAVFKLPLFGRLIHFLGAFPVSLDHVDRRALRIARALLERGEAVVVFPEGGRSATGELMPLRPGVVRLARQTGAPIVPVRIEGMFKIWPRQRLLPIPFRKIRIVYGPPLPAPVSTDKTAEEADAERILAQLAAFMEPPSPALPRG